MLSSIVTHSSQGNEFVLISGANDGFVKVRNSSLPLRSYTTFRLDLGH